jgi:hypothetical protein
MINKTFKDCIELIKDRSKHMSMEKAIVEVISALNSQEQAEIGIDYDNAVAALLRKPPVLQNISVKLEDVPKKQEEKFIIPKSTHAVKKVVKKGK